MHIAVGVFRVNSVALPKPAFVAVQINYRWAGGLLSLSRYVAGRGASCITVNSINTKDGLIKFKQFDNPVDAIKQGFNFFASSDVFEVKEDTLSLFTGEDFSVAGDAIEFMPSQYFDTLNNSYHPVAGSTVTFERDLNSFSSLGRNASSQFEESQIKAMLEEARNGDIATQRLKQLEMFVESFLVDVEAVNIKAA